MVAAFCLLSYSPFAYGQFIKPNVVPALTNFVALSPWLDLVALLVTTLTVMPELRGARGSLLARLYVGGGALVCAWMFAVRPLLTLGNRPLGLPLALLALVSPVWLAVLDHRSTAAPAIAPSDRARLAAAGLLAGVIAWTAYAVVVPLRLGQAVGIDLPARALAIGFGASLTLTLFVFAALALALLTTASVADATSRPAAVEYWLSVALLALCASLVFALLVSASIAFTGWDAWLASCALGATVAVVWADVARLRSQAWPSAGRQAIDLFCAPVLGGGSRAAATVVVVAIPFLAYVLVDAVSHFDWNFLIQKLGVLIVWLVAFTASAVLVRAKRFGAAMPAVLLTIFAAYHALNWFEQRPADDARFSPRVVLDRYLAVDP